MHAYMKISTTLKMPRENAAFQLNIEKALSLML